MRKFLRKISGDQSGSILIETAFIAPMLAAMCLGGVEISSMVARQLEMQTISSHAMDIILAAAPKSQEELTETIGEVDAYMVQASGLTSANGAAPTAGQVSVYRRWRCGNNSERQATSGCANAAQTESSFIVIYMKDEYTPVWNKYGLGDTLTFTVKRSVQVG